MLKLKLQYFGHLMQRVDSLEKTLMLGGIGAGGEGDDRGWDGWMASLPQRTWVWVNSGSWWQTGRPGMLWSIGLQRVRHDWATELTDWHALSICNVQINTAYTLRWDEAFTTKSWSYLCRWFLGYQLQIVSPHLSGLVIFFLGNFDTVFGSGWYLREHMYIWFYLAPGQKNFLMNDL